MCGSEWTWISWIAFLEAVKNGAFWSLVRLCCLGSMCSFAISSDHLFKGMSMSCSRWSFMSFLVLWDSFGVVVLLQVSYDQTKYKLTNDSHCKIPRNNLKQINRLGEISIIVYKHVRRKNGRGLTRTYIYKGNYNNHGVLKKGSMQLQLEHSLLVVIERLFPSGRHQGISRVRHQTRNSVTKAWTSRSDRWFWTADSSFSNEEWLLSLTIKRSFLISLTSHLSCYFLTKRALPEALRGASSSHMRIRLVSR